MADPAIAEWSVAFLKSPQVQSAMIAAVISLLVARLTTRRERQTRRAQRARLLLQDVYGPLDSFLLGKSLYAAVSNHRDVLVRNRPSYSKTIAPIIDQALSLHYSGPWEPLSGKVDENTSKSQSALQTLETTLRPLLKKEIDRLQAVARKGSA